MSNESFNRTMDVLNHTSYSKKTKELHFFKKMEGFLRDEILKLGLQLEGHLELSPECRFLHFHYTRTVLAIRGFKLFRIQTHLVNPPCSGFCNGTHDSLHSSETMLCFQSFKFIGQWV